MSEIEKAEARAAGVLDNVAELMERSLEAEGRSPQYKARFWAALQEEMRTRSI